MTTSAGARKTGRNGNRYIAPPASVRPFAAPSARRPVPAGQGGTGWARLDGLPAILRPADYYSPPSGGEPQTHVDSTITVCLVRQRTISLDSETAALKEEKYY